MRPSSENGFAVSVMTEWGIQHVKVTRDALEEEANLAMDIPPLLKLLRNAEELNACTTFYLTGNPVH